MPEKSSLRVLGGKFYTAKEASALESLTYLAALRQEARGISNKNVSNYATYIERPLEFLGFVPEVVERVYNFKNDKGRVYKSLKKDEQSVSFEFIPTLVVKELPCAIEQIIDTRFLGVCRSKRITEVLDLDTIHSSDEYEWPKTTEKKRGIKFSRGDDFVDLWFTKKSDNPNASIELNHKLKSGKKQTKTEAINDFVETPYGFIHLPTLIVDAFKASEMLSNLGLMKVNSTTIFVNNGESNVNGIADYIERGLNGSRTLKRAIGKSRIEDGIILAEELRGPLTYGEVKIDLSSVRRTMPELAEKIGI